MVPLSFRERMQNSSPSQGERSGEGMVFFMAFLTPTRSHRKSKVIDGTSHQSQRITRIDIQCCNKNTYFRWG
jgi:hypothetical protein